MVYLCHKTQQRNAFASAMRWICAKEQLLLGCLSQIRCWRIGALTFADRSVQRITSPPRIRLSEAARQAFSE
jgi:hypothetical protein